MSRTLLALALLAAACSAADPPGGIDGAADEADGAPIPGVDAAGPGPDAAGARLRVMTVNLQNALLGEDYQARTAIVAAAITELAPDFVALQEIVESSSIDNRAEALAEATGYHWAWEQTYSVGLFDEGTGLLSRWPIGWTDQVALPHVDLGGLNTRRVVGAGAATPHGEVAFFSAHTTLDEDEAVKADQAVAALALVEAHAGALPGFLAGDFNATPDTLAMRVLRGEAEHAGAQGALIDAWTAAEGDAPGFTIPADGPDRRIDYIYMSAGAAAAVADCSLLFAQPVGGILASDHLGLLCDVSLAP